eukprot:SRR837773.397.p1 GENE.SRR837773.397~~SRR837773.397.p1  ORF type:complete len:331 (+),score=141.22 SRR837773.397:38-994(+)
MVAPRGPCLVLLLLLLSLADFVRGLVNEAVRRPPMMRQEVPAARKAAEADGAAAASLAEEVEEAADDDDALEEDGEAADEEDASSEAGEAALDEDAEDAEDEGGEEDEDEDEDEAAADAASLAEEDATLGGRPVFPATPMEKKWCMPTFSVAKETEGSPSPYWKGTAVKHTDVKNFEGVYSYSSCLTKAVSECFVASAVMWHSSTHFCTCLYGDVNPEGGSATHHQWVCKLKKEHMASLCYFPNWVVGACTNVTRTALSSQTSAAKCAEHAKDKGCDAAEMPRGKSGKCTCVKKIDKTKKLHINGTNHSQGVCILSYK